MKATRYNTASETPSPDEISLGSTQKLAINTANPASMVAHRKAAPTPIVEHLLHRLARAKTIHKIIKAATATMMYIAHNAFTDKPMISLL